MHFDSTVTLGNVLSTVAMVGAVVVAYIGLRERMVEIEVKLRPLWAEFERRRGSR